MIKDKKRNNKYFEYKLANQNPFSYLARVATSGIASVQHNFDIDIF